MLSHPQSKHLFYSAAPTQRAQLCTDRHRERVCVRHVCVFVCVQVCGSKEHEARNSQHLSFFLRTCQWLCNRPLQSTVACRVRGWSLLALSVAFPYVSPPCHSPSCSLSLTASSYIYSTFNGAEYWFHFFKFSPYVAPFLTSLVTPSFSQSAPVWIRLLTTPSLHPGWGQTKCTFMVFVWEWKQERKKRALLGPLLSLWTMVALNCLATWSPPHSPNRQGMSHLLKHKNRVSCFPTCPRLQGCTWSITFYLNLNQESYN